MHSGNEDMLSFRWKSQEHIKETCVQWTLIKMTQHSSFQVESI